jgi:integrase
MASGPGWIENDLVFTREDGNPIDPDGFSKRFGRLTRRAGLPRIRLHDLRHTHASIMLAAGVHAKVVQERLGHSSIQVTLDIYSHVAPSLHKEAAE